MRKKNILIVVSNYYKEISDLMLKEATETVQPVEYFRKSTSVQDLANTLNGGMVLSPRDIIAIFQAIDQAGALRAKLIII